MGTGITIRPWTKDTKDLGTWSPRYIYEPLLRDFRIMTQNFEDFGFVQKRGERALKSDATPVVLAGLEVVHQWPYFHKDKTEARCSNCSAPSCW